MCWHILMLLREAVLSVEKVCIGSFERSLCLEFKLNSDESAVYIEGDQYVCVDVWISE